jgi:hypothetical protein
MGEVRSLRSLGLGGAAVGAIALGTVALGAVAVGAGAIGALTIWRLAIRRMAVDRASFRALDIHELTVTRIRAGDITVSRSLELPGGADRSSLR